MNGDAARVPELVRGLCDPATEMAAVGALEDLLVHQGGAIVSAVPPVLPFLLDVVEDRGVGVRAPVLELISWLVLDAARVSPEWVDPGWPSAWGSVRPRILALLADDDQGVQVQAAQALAWTVDAADEVVSAFRARFVVEDSVVVRAALVGLVGDVVGSGRLTAPDEQREWLTELSRSEQEPTVAAVALFEARRSGVGATPTASDGDGDDAGALVERLARVDVTVLSRAGVTGVSWPGALHWVGNCLAHNAGLRRRVATRALTHPHSGLRAAAAGECARILCSTSEGEQDLVVAAVDGLRDPDGAVRAWCAFMLAAMGPAADSPRTTKDLRLLLNDDSPAVITNVPVHAVAAWALVRLRDPAALPYVSRAVANGGGQFGTSRAYYPPDSLLISLPSIDEILGFAAHSAESLLPAVTDRLRRGRDYHELRALAEALTNWGPVAAPAIPRLTRLLDSPAVQWAAQALGGIGPAARGAAGKLARTTARAQDSRTRVEAAAAHHRVTGETDLALRTLLAAMADRATASSAARHLADLGSDARSALPALRQAAQSPDNWVRVEARHALHSIDKTSLDTVLDGIQPAGGQVLPVFATAVAYLARHGATGPARDTLSTVLNTRTRLAHAGGWRAVDTDQQIRRDAVTALNHGQAMP